jgi:hypothetical protein
MGSTINTKKLAPDKDLAIIGGFLKGLSQKKKDMEEAQIKEQELALKEYRERKQAEYWMRMAGAREQQVKAQAKRWDDMTLDELERRIIDAQRAQAYIKSVDIDEERLNLELRKYRNKDVDFAYEEALKWRYEEKKQFLANKYKEAGDDAKFNYDMRLQGMNAQAAMDRTKETTGTQRDINRANISSGLQKFGAVQGYDRWKT